MPLSKVLPVFKEEFESLKQFTLALPFTMRKRRCGCSAASCACSLSVVVMVPGYCAEFEINLYSEVWFFKD